LSIVSQTGFSLKGLNYVVCNIEAMAEISGRAHPHQWRAPLRISPEDRCTPALFPA
jgi:hypothetical protein